MSQSAGTAATDGEPGIEDAMEELEELESIVDTDAELEQVRETMHVLRRVRRPRPFGRLTGRFDLRDAGEALVGSFLLGIPMVVEDGTLTIGAYLARHGLYFAATVAFGLAVVVGILYAAEFEKVEEDLLLGVVPRRLVGILVVAGGTAALLMTIWGRVDWADPWVATGQTTVAAIVMAVGASIGDVLPEA